MNFLEELEQATRPDVPPKPWFSSVHMELVTDETLDRVIDECIASGLYAIDVETSGKDSRVFDGRTKDRIAGVGLSPDGQRGYYIPVFHAPNEDICISVPRFHQAMLRLVQSKAVAIFHGGKFDHEFLQFSGGEPLGEWDDAAQWEDTYILAYLRDSRSRELGLKKLSPEMLDMDMIELEELFPAEVKTRDFTTLDITWSPALWYATSDVICTWRLFPKLREEVLEKTIRESKGQRAVYQLEKMCVPATRWMERCRVHVDEKKVAELMTLGQREMFDCLRDIYDFCNDALGRNVEPAWFRILRRKFVADDPSNNLNQQIEDCRGEAKRMAGASLRPEDEEIADRLDSRGHFVSIKKHVELKIDGKNEVFDDFPERYDVLSRPQLGPLFCELQIPGLRRTGKSEQIQTTQDIIDKLESDHGKKYPFLPKIRRLGELTKALGTYLVSLHGDRGPDSTIKVNYKQQGTDTGRFTTPGSENPAMDGGTKFPMHGTPATYDKSRPQCLLRIREAITARPGKVLVSCDFSGVELRIATILSREPKWMREFFRCSTCGQEFDAGDGTYTPEPPPPFCPKCGDDRIGDLHTLTAITFFGEEAVGGKQWKQQRNEAKCVHPDTLVFTDEGPRTLRAAFQFGPRDTFREARGQVWTGQSFAKTVHTYNGGPKRLYHVVSHRGIVTCSANHKFLTADGRLVSVSRGLKVGTDLAVSAHPICRSRGWPTITYRCAEDVPPVSFKATADLAYFCGLYVGDGIKGGTRSVAISHGAVGKIDKTGVPYREWQKLLVATCEALGFRPVARKAHVYLGWRSVMRYFKALHLFDGDRRRLRIPDWILAAGRKALFSFMGGLIDSDGSVDLRDHRIEITSKDAVFVGQIAAALDTMGFSPRVEPMWNKTYRRYYYRIVIKASQARKLLPYMKHRGKRSRIRSAMAPNRRDENTVLAIISAGKQPCVDLAIATRDHIYWTNGVLTHNTSNFALAYGGGPAAIERAIGCSNDEAARHHRAFNQTYSTLRSWWDYIKKFGAKHGFVETAFGRRYPLPDIQLPVTQREVHKFLTDQYEKKLADGKKASPPDEADVKQQMSLHRKFRGKAERNATNGPIQGLSADITKLAMGAIYRECKKRGWFDKVYMTITIHDELVFEIDEDILAEAIERVRELMARSKAILNMKWPVPLTTDCEIGYDWTVPWNVNVFRAGRVRSDGIEVDAKGQPTGKLWPDNLVRIFAAAYGTADAPRPATEASPAHSSAPERAPDAPEAALPETPLREAQSQQDESAAGDRQVVETTPRPVTADPALPAGQPYEYRVRRLSVRVAHDLARVIVECRWSGSHPLQVVGPAGESLLWEGAEEILVDPHHFEVLARHYGL